MVDCPPPEPGACADGRVVLIGCTAWPRHYAGDAAGARYEIRDAVELAESLVHNGALPATAAAVARALGEFDVRRQGHAMGQYSSRGTTVERLVDFVVAEWACAAGGRMNFEGPSAPALMTLSAHRVLMNNFEPFERVMLTANGTLQVVLRRPLWVCGVAGRHARQTLGGRWRETNCEANWGAGTAPNALKYGSNVGKQDPIWEIGPFWRETSQSGDCKPPEMYWNG